MTASILRTVLAVAIVLGVGIIANIFANQQQIAGGHLAQRASGHVAPTERTIATKKLDGVAEQRRVLDGVRRQLRERGYLVKSGGDNADVLMQAAILAFEFDYHLALTGEPSEPVLKALIFTHAKITSDHHAVPETSVARNLIVEVQRALADLGYGDAETTGQLDAATRSAISKFERARGLQVSGRVSAPLIDSLGPAFDGARLGSAARPVVGEAVKG